MRSNFVILFLLYLLSNSLVSQAQVVENLSPSLYYAAWSMYDKSNYLEAITYLDKIDPTDSLFAAAQDLKMQSLYYSNRTEEAVELGLKSLGDSEFGSEIMYAFTGFAYLKLENYVESVKYLSKTCKIYALNSDYHNWLAFAALNINDLELARTHYMWSIMLEYNRPQSTRALGYVYSKTRDDMVACYPLMSGIISWPNNPHAGSSSTKIRQVMGNNKHIPEGTYETNNPNSIFASMQNEWADSFAKDSVNRMDDYISFLCNRLPDKNTSADFIFNFYAPYFKRVGELKLDKALSQYVQYFEGLRPDPRTKRKYARKIKQLELLYKSFESHADSFLVVGLGGREMRYPVHRTTDGYIWGIGFAKDTAATPQSRDGYWAFADVSARITCFGHYDKGKKDGEWVWYNRNGDIESTIRYADDLITDTATTYYTNGSLQFQKVFRAGKLHGTTTEFYPNGKLKQIQNFTDGMLNGPYIDYFVSGNREVESFYRNNKLDSTFVQYYENGKIKLKYEYRNDKLEGSGTNYSEKGKLIAAFTFKEDHKIGDALWYYESGKIQKKASFDKEGFVSGKLTSYYENGQIEEVSTYKHGNIEGAVLGYSELGKLEYRYNYENGTMQSFSCFDDKGKIIKSDTAQENSLLVETYYSNRNLQTKGAYQNGRKQGIWQYYYPSGRLRSVQNYEDGLRQGQSKIYYPDGKPLSIQYYENDLADGSYTSYFRNDTIEISGRYRKDEKVGIWTEQYINGAKKVVTPYQNGEIQGFYRQYNPAGQVNLEILYDHGTVLREIEYENQPDKSEPILYDHNDSVFIKWNSKKVALSRCTIENGVFNGAYTINYPNGMLEEKGQYLNGKNHGHILKYHPFTGTVILDAWLNNGDNIGTWIWRDFLGNLQQKTTYLPEGFVEYGYDPIGVLHTETHTLEDTTHITLKTFLPTGELLCTQILEEESVISVSPGPKFRANNKTQQISLENNKLKYFYPNGRVAFSESYDDGYRSDTTKVYYKNGQLYRATCYKEGKKTGKEVYYYANGQIMQSVDYYYDVLMGKSIFYTADGTQLLNCETKLDFDHGTEILLDPKTKTSKNFQYYFNKLLIW
ncbi:MAG: hypothetical protein RIS47_1304 [Bacteroidota bacterium]